ncbi:MAG: P-loop containing nucleoside triphosphate hydrolase protein [Benjaminiella poitrasii]|nr:MAG: P-loop containing nucleoside triphosphate hydrolase protein [Benjaminiella poitrasii]
MFRNIFSSSRFKASSFRTLTTLSKSRAKLNTVQLPLLRNQEIRPRILNDLKISPYAFLHTKSSALGASVAELVQEKVQDDSIGKIEPVPETKKFSDITFLNRFTQNAITKVFKYEEMSSVQEAVLSKLPNHNDMFVKAKTGTGKTLAFLIAALETAIAGQTPKDFKHFNGTSIMVISPTRELANQIADEAQKIVRYYPFKVHCLVGGDSKRRQVSKLQYNRCDIVVATPGRLYDMLSSVPQFKKMCENLKVLVLDEADQLLDMGFKQELKRILNEIPTERQTMLYSATISPEIRENLGKFALSPNYDLIDTVGENDVNTHLHVKQSAVIAPYHQQLAVMRDCLENHEAAKKGKVIVFLPTTKATMVYANIFKQLLPDRMVYEIHSKKGQDQRSRIADRFRKSHESSILFTSDVSARGVDYPGVSLVFQVGVPSTREQYIHRLGRTGRAGREGEGILMLAPFEESFLKNEVSDLPIQKINSSDSLSQEEIDDTNKTVTKSIRMMDSELVREVYTAYLGYYSGRYQMLGLRRSKVLPEAKSFLHGLGVEEVPHLSARFLSQLGLSESNSNEQKHGHSKYSNSKYGGYSNNNDRYESYSKHSNRGDGFKRTYDRRDRFGGNTERNDGFKRTYDRRDKSHRNNVQRDRNYGSRRNENYEKNSFFKE